MLQAKPSWIPWSSPHPGMASTVGAQLMMEVELVLVQLSGKVLLKLRQMHVRTGAPLAPCHPNSSICQFVFESKP